MLAPYLPFNADESPLSFAVRLARFHTGDRLVPFLRDIGVKPEQMQKSETVALSRLAEVSGVALADLRENAAVYVASRAYDLRGEMVTAEFLANPHTAFCPACLLDDDRNGMRRGRWGWTLSIFRTCPAHNIPLLRKAYKNYDDNFHELDLRVPERGAELAALVSAAESRSVSPLQDYVMQRLVGKRGPAWLDAQTLDQATRATELLGVLVAFGPTQNLPKLSQDDWDHAGRVGFGFTARGEAGIREALGAQFQQFDQTSKKPGAKSVYGCFYEALANSRSGKDRGDIVRIFRSLLIERIAFPAGMKVLKVELPERILHTVASLAKEQGLDGRTLRSVLIAANVIPDKAPAHFPFPVERGREVASRVKRLVHVISLGGVLNCSRILVEQLFSDRLLTPIYSGRPGIKGRTQKAVDHEEITMLVGKLHAKAILTEGARADMVPVSKAAERSKVPAIMVLHLILGGFLEHVVRLAGQEGIGALRVDPAEVKRQAGTVCWRLSSIEAFTALKIPREVGWQLIDEYESVTGLTVTEVVCPDADHSIWRFEPESVAAFKADFTTPARLAEQHGMRVGDVVGRMRKSGVKPIIPRADIGVEFYRISELKESLFF